MKTFYVGICASALLLLTSCGGWVDTQEEEFMKQCEKNFTQGFESTAGFEVDQAKVKEVCSCSLEKIKEKFSFIEATSEDNQKEIESIMAECTEATFEIELD